MINFNNFVIESIAQNIKNMSDEDLQQLAFSLSESVSNKLCDYLAFAIQDAQISKLHEDEITSPAKVLTVC